MEEEPTAIAPDLEAEKTNFIINQSATDHPDTSEIPEALETPETPETPKTPDADFDLSDITHQKQDLSREDIIAAAEEAAYRE